MKLYVPKIDSLIEKARALETVHTPGAVEGFYCCCHVARAKLERAKSLTNLFDQVNLINEAEATLNNHHLYVEKA